MWKALIKLIEKMACSHKYSLEERISWQHETKDLPSRFTRIYSCEKCGKFKVLKIK